MEYIDHAENTLVIAPYRQHMAVVGPGRGRTTFSRNLGLSTHEMQPKTPMSTTYCSTPTALHERHTDDLRVHTEIFSTARLGGSTDEPRRLFYDLAAKHGSIDSAGPAAILQHTRRRTHDHPSFTHDVPIDSCQALIHHISTESYADEHFIRVRGHRR
nr:hypothetical protein CFP56_36321 [Quercus suber]